MSESEMPCGLSGDVTGVIRLSWEERRRPVAGGRCPEAL